MKLKSESLAAQLEKGLLPVYLVTGDDPLLVGEAADAIRAQARASGFTERETHFIQRVTDWEAAGASVNNRSLFAARRILEVRMASGKPGVAGGAALTKLAQLSDPEVLVLIIAPRLEAEANSNPGIKEIEAKGAIVVIQSIDAAQMISWLQRRAKSLGVQLDDAALEVLAEHTEGNLLAAHQELQKLLLLYPGAAVDAAAVLTSVGESARFSVGQLAESLLGGDTARALHVLAGLRAEGVEPTLVLWHVTKAVRDLWRAQSSGGQGYAGQRSWNPHGAALARGLKRARDVPYGRMIVRAERSDRMIKGRIKGDAWDEIALLAAEFCTRPVLPLPRAVFK